MQASGDPTRALVSHVHWLRIGSISECFFSNFLGLYLSAPSISDYFPTCKFAIFVPNILAIYNFSENFLSKLLPTLTQLENYVGYISGLQHTFPVLIKVLWSEQCCGSVGGMSHFTVNITFFFPGLVLDYLLLGLLGIGVYFRHRALVFNVHWSNLGHILEHVFGLFFRRDVIILVVFFYYFPTSKIGILHSKLCAT